MAEEKPTDSTSAAKPSLINNTFTLEHWEKTWVNGFSDLWDEPDGNKQLWDHFGKVMKDVFPTKEVTDLKVFVPMCGSTRDLYRFYQLGCAVVGVEYVAKPIQEFFEKYSVPICEKKGDGPFTRSIDDRMIIGQGDVFTFKGNPESGLTTLPYPKYDVIWDRGSLSSVNKKDRYKFAEHVKGLLADDGIYLICSFEYDQTRYEGPPAVITREDLIEYYGMSVQELDKSDRLLEETPEMQYSKDNWGIATMFETLYMLRRV